MPKVTKPTPEPVREIVRETIQASHKFNSEEMLELGRQVVASLANQDQIDAEFDSLKSEFKGRIEKAQLETDSLRRKHSDGFEMRPTLAQIIFHAPEHGRKTYVRDDNGQTIREEAMTFADMERPLFVNENGGDATKPEEAAP